MKDRNALNDDIQKEHLDNKHSTMTMFICVLKTTSGILIINLLASTPHFRTHVGDMTKILYHDMTNFIPR